LHFCNTAGWRNLDAIMPVVRSWRIAEFTACR
jgi:hypothetical protein